MNFYRYWRSNLVRLIFVIPVLLLLMPSFPLFAMEEPGMSMEQIQKPEFLQEIAYTILKRTEQISSLKEKVCKHDAIMVDTWKSRKKWGELDPGLQKKLTLFIPQSQVQSILRRARHSLLSTEIIEHPLEFAQTVIKEGKPTLVKTGESGNGYAIKISADIKPRMAGIIYFKTETEIKEVSESRIYISFDVTKLIPKLIKSGLHAWDKEADGFVTTLCLDE